MKIIDKISELKAKDKKTLILICTGAIAILIVIAVSILTSDDNSGRGVSGYQGPGTKDMIPATEQEDVASSRSEAFEREQERTAHNKRTTNPMIDGDADIETIFNNSSSEPVQQESATPASSNSLLDDTPATTPPPASRKKENPVITTGKPAPKSKDDEVEAFFFGSQKAEQSAEKAKEEEKKPATASSTPKTALYTPEQRDARRRQLEEEFRRKYRTPEEIAAEEAAKAQAREDSIAAEKQKLIDEAFAQKATVIRSSKGISSLEDSFGTGGVTSITDDNNTVSSTLRPIQVRFAQTEKVRSGQRVNLRLMEDMVINNILIPSNSIIPATVELSGSRLNIRITTLQLGGQMYSLDYVAYDTDGGEGLYCAETKVNTATKQAVRELGQIGSSAILERMTGISQRALNSAVSIVRGSSNDSPITVPSGYTFFIMPKIK